MFTPVYSCQPYVYSCLPMFTNVYSYMFTYIFPCLLGFTYVYTFKPMFPSIICLSMLSTVYSGIFIYVYPSLLVFTYVYTCLPMFATDYSRLSVYKSLTMLTPV